MIAGVSEAFQEIQGSQESSKGSQWRCRGSHGHFKGPQEVPGDIWRSEECLRRCHGVLGGLRGVSGDLWDASCY